MRSYLCMKDLQANIREICFYNIIRWYKYVNVNKMLMSAN